MEAVYTALYGLRTTTEPLWKRNCVQVTYAGDSRIHIDVPIYYLTRLSGDLNPHLATKSGWIRSSPYQFDKWYGERRNRQLTRIIRYIKAWIDNQRKYGKMPKGVALTVMAATCYSSHERDDVCFVQTLTEIQQALLKQWQCTMPVEPFDNLLRDCSGADKQAFLARLNHLLTDGNRALETSRKQTALKLWKTHLGRYFDK